METATFRRTAALGLAAIALIAAGCGSSSSSRSAFSWLHPAAPPSGWRTVTIPLGASMAYPPAWKRMRGDAGTATAALLDAGHHFLGYLNLTPRQSTESLANWGRFRVHHNAEEGDWNIKTLAVGMRLRFRGARGSCVRDAYTTAVGAHYVELACLVSGRTASVVIVGASPPQAWPGVAPVLERAISAVRA